MYNGVEKRILEKMSTKLVMKKTEIMAIISKDVSSPRQVLKSVMKALSQRGLVVPVYAYESTFAITQKGIKEASRL